jgi:hypothetical protein
VTIEALATKFSKFNFQTLDKIKMISVLSVGKSTNPIEKVDYSLFLIHG